MVTPPKPPRTTSPQPATANSGPLVVPQASPHHAREFDSRDLDLLDEMARRISEIDNSYRAVAEKVGQLYMRADEAGLEQLTEMLDKPMRNASDNQQSFAALLREVRQASQRRR
jgi:hypothetical protein